MSRSKNSQRIASQPSASVRSRAMNLPLTLMAGVPYDVPSSTPGNSLASSNAALNFGSAGVLVLAMPKLYAHVPQGCEHAHDAPSLAVAELEFDRQPVQGRCRP